MKSLVIGAGEVGRAIYEVLKPFHDTFIKDIEDFDINGIEVLHICYPDHNGFDQTTTNYIAKYKPYLTIIHSSVSVGTTEKCGEHVVYSPVRGRHPKLVSDLKIYTKYIFSNNLADAQLAKIYLEQAQLTTVNFTGPKAGEFLKLISNIHMGLEIAWRQEVERMLKSFNIPTSVYENWEHTYRDGYLNSGDINLIRPSMRPDPIGGHCILPCTEILKAQYPSLFLDAILESNKKEVTKEFTKELTAA